MNDVTRLVIDRWTVNGKIIAVLRIIDGVLFGSEAERARFEEALQAIQSRGVWEKMFRRRRIAVVDLALCNGITESGRDCLRKFLTRKPEWTLHVVVGANGQIYEAMKPTRLEALFITFPNVDTVARAFACNEALLSD